MKDLAGLYRRGMEVHAAPKKMTAAEKQEQNRKAYNILVEMSPKKVREMVHHILDMYEEGKYTVEECCKAWGCTMQVFSRWVRPEMVVEEMMLRGKEIPITCFPDLNARYHEVKDIAAENYAMTLKQVSRSALMKKVTGYVSVEVSETRVIDSRLTIFDEATGNEVANPNFGKLMVTAQRIKKKQEAPDTAAIIFALTNVDKKTFKNRNSISADAPDEIDLSNISDDALEEQIRALEEKHSKI